jgi:hypothetical protein
LFIGDWYTKSHTVSPDSEPCEWLCL